MINSLSGHMPDHILDRMTEIKLNPLLNLMFYIITEKYPLEFVCL